MLHKGFLRNIIGMREKENMKNILLQLNKCVSGPSFLKVEKDLKNWMKRVDGRKNQLNIINTQLQLMQQGTNQSFPKMV